MTFKLKELREAAGYSIEHIASKLNIRKQYLVALEEGDYNSIPGKIYVEGYTKMYYEFLGINLQSQQHHNRNLTTASLSDSADSVYITNNKYKKCITICSIILLALSVISYNLLKPRATNASLITESNNGNKQKTSNGSDKADK